MTSNGKGGRPIGLAKTGGRKKGTPNRNTRTIQEKLDAIGCDPLIELARIAQDTKNPIEIRAKCLIEVAYYVYPKRKPIEGSTDQSTVTNVITTLDSSGGGSDVGNQPNASS